MAERRQGQQPCPRCGVPTRPTGTPAATLPGTRIRRGAEGLCSRCYAETPEGRTRRARRARVRWAPRQQGTSPSPSPRPAPAPTPDHRSRLQQSADEGNPNAATLLRYFQSRAPHRARARRDTEDPQ